MKELGPYTAGEIPEPLTVTFNDANGDPINLDGWAAKFSIRRSNEPVDEATVNAADVTGGGQVAYTWTAQDLTEPGLFYAEVWVGDGTNRYASEQFVLIVRTPVSAVPNI